MQFDSHRPPDLHQVYLNTSQQLHSVTEHFDESKEVATVHGMAHASFEHIQVKEHCHRFVAHLSVYTKETGTAHVRVWLFPSCVRVDVESAVLNQCLMVNLIANFCRKLKEPELSPWKFGDFGRCGNSLGLLGAPLAHRSCLRLLWSALKNAVTQGAAVLLADSSFVRMTSVKTTLEVPLWCNLRFGLIEINHEIDVVLEMKSSECFENLENAFGLPYGPKKLRDIYKAIVW